MSGRPSLKNLKGRLTLFSYEKANKRGEAARAAAASFRILSPGDFRPRFYDPFFLTVRQAKQVAKTVTCENVLLKHLGNFPPPCILKGREYRIVRMTTLVKHS